MQSASSRIWIRVAVSISYDDNHYTTGTSISIYVCVCVCVRVCLQRRENLKDFHSAVLLKSNKQICHKNVTAYFHFT